MPENSYEILTLADGVFAIDEGGVRSFLIVGDARAALIDAGFGKIDVLAAARTRTDKPIDLYLTHADSDHTGGAHAFDALTLHRDELSRLMAKAPAYSGEIRFYEDGDALLLPPFAFTVLHVPGHTPGSVALLEKNKRFLISGDTAQLNPVFMFGEGRDLDAYIRSLERLCKLSDAFDVIYPSHGAIPIAPDTLSELAEGARLLQQGALTPVDPPMPLPCKLYRHARARFLM